MAFLPGIFGPKPAPAPAATPAAAPAPATNSNGSAGPVSNQGAGPANPAANPATMTGATGTPSAGDTKTPTLDHFKDLFSPRPADPNAVRALTLQDPILAPVDAAKLREQVAKADFAQGLPPDLMQKAMGGDAQAFMDVLNHVGRESFMAATTISHGLAENGARTAAERVSGTLDSRIRTNLIRGQNVSNETLKSPAVAPVFQAVKDAIANANPTLSPDAVQTQAENYFNAMASDLTAPQRQAAETKTKPAGGDFSYLLDNN